jgi:hypothetical protein
VAGPSSAAAVPPLGGRARRVTRRFAEIVCPPGMRAHHRTDRTLAEFELMLGALAPGARKAMIAALITLDEGARLYPPSRGRRFSRLDDRAAEAYIRALLSGRSIAADLVQRLKSLIVMCYYELPTVQREIGYDPAPYIAAVSRRRLETYAPQIHTGEQEAMIVGQNGHYLPKTTHNHENQPARDASAP